MKTRGLFSAVAFAILILVSPLFAQTGGKETKIMIRAIARDAKVIGTHVGGARITVRDVATGEILAQGMEQGGTGDTDVIMKKPHTRGMTVFSAGDTSGYLAVLHLDKPTVVEVSAEGPLGNAQATQRSSKTLLLVPGEDVLGEGILLEIHGFIITPLAPLPDAKVKAGSPFEVRATVTMACGCPTEPDGLWDANKIRVVARLLRNGKVESEIPMTYAGVQNTFHVDVPVIAPGPMELQVLALDPGSANFGMNREAIAIVP
ncbi:MAG TPA: hypothetical protein VN976_16610 [Verrucomicrobiae bacterium]|nr:hypothetical protein [Verrucomicrobiae bacterium]